MVAFDRTSGAWRWRFASPHGYGAGIYLGDVADDLIYTGSSSGNLFAIDLSGSLRWSATPVDWDQTTVFDPVVAGRTVVAAFVSFGEHSRGGIAAFDRESGAERWRATFGRSASGAGALPTGSVTATRRAVFATSRDGGVHALDCESGAEMWSRPGLPDVRVGWPDAPNDYRALAVAAGTVVAGSLSGVVTAYDATTGRERWHRSSSSASVGFEIGADEDQAYVPYLSGDLHVLDIRTGAERWRVDTTARGFTWRPAIAAGRLFAASSAEGFFAFSL